MIMKKDFKLSVISLAGIALASLGMSGCDLSSSSSQTGTSSSTTSSSTSPLTLSSVSSVAPDGTVTLTGSGGVSPYTYSLVSGSGSVSGSTYTAPSSTGSATVEVTDSAGSISQATICITDTLTITVSSSSVLSGGQVTLTTSGGLAPYTYSILLGGGSISGNVYTAPVYSVSAEILVTDANGMTATQVISVVKSGSIGINIPSQTLYEGELVTLSASGGIAPYTYAVISGSGSLSGAAFTAPSTVEKDTIQVWDSNGATGSTVISIVKKVPLYDTSAPFYTEGYGVLIFNMPKNANSGYLPSFVLAGANSNGKVGGGSSLTNITTAMVSSGWVNAVVLDNFSWTDSSPYTGTITVSGQNGMLQNEYVFCIQNGSSSAILSDPGNNNYTVFQNPLGFIYPSLFTSASAGRSTSALVVQNIFGAAAFYVTSAYHEHYLSDCSSFKNSYSISSNSTN